MMPCQGLNQDHSEASQEKGDLEGCESRALLCVFSFPELVKGCGQGLCLGRHARGSSPACAWATHNWETRLHASMSTDTTAALELRDSDCRMYAGE
jgi:hypothetical protein